MPEKMNGAMERYWVIGFGKVGRRALDRLRRKTPAAAFSVIDPMVPATEADTGAVRWIADDGVKFLLDRELNDDGLESPWIVPALPLHLAYEWLIRRLAAYGTAFPCCTAIPESVIQNLPNPARGPEGQVFISVADTLCPDNCNEPMKKCPRTGKPRPYALYEHIGNISPSSFQSVVVRSHQLAPGVGGYRGSQLTNALETILKHPGKYLFSTASRCHGVMHAFEMQLK